MQKAEGIPLELWVDLDVDRTGPKGRGEFRYVDIGSIDRFSKQIVDAATLPVAKAPSRAKQILKTNDVLVSMTRPNLNAVALVPRRLNGAIGSTGFHVLRARHADPKFLFYAVQTQDFIQTMSLKVQGALYPAVRPTDISSFCLPPFSLGYQRQLVARIEELFSELEAGEESLRVARRQLGVYRQSLLKQAFEGRLTAKWRTQNPDSASAGWREVEVSDVLTSKPTNGRSVKDRAGGFRVLRLTAIKGGVIDPNESKEGDWDAADAAAHLIRKGNFLLSRGNGSIRLVGRGGIVRADADIAFPDTMIRLPLNLRLVDPLFFSYLWNSQQVRAQIEASARTTAGIYKINQSLLTRYRIPLPSLPEQQEIARLLDEQFEVIERNERELDGALRQSEALRQAILQKAFIGRLVPQSPADEPASELLARVQQKVVAYPERSDERAVMVAESPSRAATRRRSRKAESR